MSKWLVVLVLLAGFVFAEEKPAAPPAGITKAALEARLTELKNGKDQAVANLNAFTGAIQECEHWLEFLKAAEDAKAKPQPAPPKGKEQPH